MLSRLFIQNYVIIDELGIDFSGKLNVITGETGAGKSIIAGALGLILGERADTGALVNKEKKCVVEGVFEAGHKKSVADFLLAHELDSGQELVLRREIGTNGKSRAFINDTPVNLTQLQEISSLLVDLHQQFDTLDLNKSDFQREVLDALAGQFPVVGDYQLLFNQWQEIKKETEELRRQKQQFDKEADFDRFQFAELEEAAFRENELETIEAELKLLNNAEGIKTALDKVYQELKENETPVVQQLKSLLNQLAHYSTYHPELPPLIQRLQSAQIELTDIAGDLEKLSNHINYDPVRMEQFNERLALGYKLQKKHGVQSTGQLLVIQEQLETKLQSVLNLDEVIRQKEGESEQLLGKLVKMGERISAGRRQQVKPLQEKVNKLLAQVGMPNAGIKVEIVPAELNFYGGDKIEFLFDANLPRKQAGLPAGGELKTGQYLPVRKVASGGELSRLMLCIKSLVAASVDLPTMIFDEIDTGISGEAARQVGIILKELAGKRQVICITHQPQIAGKADAHFFVYKEIVKNAVKTNIRLLSNEERITAIAKMLSGEKPTAAAMENAREMVRN